MADARDKYLEPEERLALRTEDVYQTDKDVDTLNYSDKLLQIVATFSNSGQPEGWSVQSMVGRSKRGEVALRLFAVVEPVEEEESDSTKPTATTLEACDTIPGADTNAKCSDSDNHLPTNAAVDLTDPNLLSQWRFGPVRFKSRGCLAMTACASVICDMIEGLTFEEALKITPEQVKEAVGGVPWDKLHTTVFAVEAIRGLVGDWIIHHGATFDELESLLPCDPMDPYCLMCEHCSLRAFRTDLRMDALLAQPAALSQEQPENPREEEPPQADGNSLNSRDAEEEPEGLQETAFATDAPTDDSNITPEMRELLENNALAELFDTVRVYSADSQLLTPDLWAESEIIPEFTTPDDFEMFVYEYLESYRAEHPLAREDHSKPASEEAALAPEERTSAHGFRSATGAVGIAPSIRDIMAARRAADTISTEGTTPPTAEVGSSNNTDVAHAATGSVASVLPEDQPAQESASGGSTHEENSVANNPYADLKLPKGYEMVQLEDGQWAMAAIPADRVPDRREVHCEDIVALTGQYTYYLYDRSRMTDSYAHWAFLAAENDPLVTFADLVREDSRTYPRPMAQKSLHNEPFAMSTEAVEEAYHLALRTKGYEDIQRTEASNGDVYYFSTTYLSPRQAEALAEWASVERVANP